MSLTKCTAAVDNVSSLPDKPALTAAQLKAKFDKTGSDIKNYLNNTLTDELDTVLGGKLDVVALTGSVTCDILYTDGGYWGHKEISYPTGYTQSNTYVLSVMLKDTTSSNDTFWRDHHSTIRKLDAESFSIQGEQEVDLNLTNIEIKAVRYSGSGTLNYRVLIGKKS